MLKLVIAFDEEKIREEQVCTVEMLYAKIDRAIQKAHLRKVKDGIYMDTGNPYGFDKVFRYYRLVKANGMVSPVRRPDGLAP